MQKGSIWKLVFTLMLSCLLVNIVPGLVSAQPTVVVIPIKGEINEGQTALVLRSIEEAERAKASAIIVEIDTFGGKVDAATQIRDKILATPIPTVAYIKNRAWSAGALIAISCKHIAIATAGSIGAAEPIPMTEKTVSAVKAEFASTASARGRDVRLAEAMVDKTLGYPGLVEAGKILSLTAEQAKQYRYAELVTDDRQAIVSWMGLPGAQVSEAQQTSADKAIGFLNNPVVQSLLVSAIFLAIMMEIKTAGVGIAAAIGLAAAGLLFLSQMMTGMANWLEIILFLLGLGLVAFELLVPGGFIAGILGVIAIFSSLFLVLGADTMAGYLLSGAFFLALIVFALVAKRLPNSKLWNKFVLKQAETSDHGFVSGQDYTVYLGQKGRAVTQLRPAGIVEVDGHRLDAVTEGSFLDSGVVVEVVQVDGYRIVVRAVDNNKV